MIDLKKVGAYRYAGDPTTEVLCAAFAVDDGPIDLWMRDQPVPDIIVRAVAEGWTFRAYNAAFERAIWNRVLAPRHGWPEPKLEHWRCSMAASAASALPGSLDHVADALALPVRKDEDGQQIMLEMCRPRQRLPGEDPNIPHWHEDPARLVRLGEYCKRDVEVERLIAQRVPPLSDNEQALWILDQQINRRGFAVDIPLATAARELSRATLIEINHELDTLTGGRVTSVSQVARIIALVQERGHKIENLGKRNVSAVLAAGPSEKIARLLTLRQEGSRASANKLETLLASANDGRLHGALRFHGAATGRWSGHGFQPHNLSREQPDDPNAAIAAVLSGDIERVRTIGSPLDVIGSLSRALICAAPGHTLIGADYSGIEARVTAWFAGEQWKLDTFRRFDATGDPTIEPYCVAASRIFGHPITPEDEEARHIGKMCELAFGFGGGLGAFRRIAPDADFTDEEVETFKRQWRSAHPNIVRFWGSLHRTLLRAVRTRTPMTLRNISTEMRDGNLYLKLPSGREIVYPQARIEPGAYDSDRIVFKDSALGKWRDVERSWHGLFVENVVQATARDLLAAAMPRLEAAGYTIVLHVHDEIVCEVPEDFGEVAEFTRLMTELPAWAEGLPLVAKTSRRQRYAKAEASTETIEESLSLEGANDDAPDECPAECTPEAAAMPDTTDDSAPEPLPVAPAEINEIKRERIDTIEIAPPALAAAITSMSRVGGIANDGIYREPPRRSSGSRVDGFSEKHAGKAYTDAHLRARGYQFARAFPFELPDGTKLYEERRYELRAGVTPTEELERKTCRFCHVDAGVTRFDTGPRRIIYNWPAIMRAGPGATVHITEGASKSAPLNAAGLLATAVAYHKWEPECVAALAGLHLIYHEDHDDNGRTYSADARKHLAPIAASFRIVPAAHVQSDRARAVADRRREGLARSRRRSGKANRHLPGNSRGPRFSIATVIAAVMAVNYDPRRLRPGERAVIMLLAVDREQAKIAFNYLAALFREVRALAKLVRRVTDDSIELGNNVDVEVHTNSFRSVRGRSLLCVICDEVAFWRSEDSQNPDSEVVAAVQPGLGRIPGSMLILISSAHKRSGLLYDRWKAHYGRDSDVLVVKGGTLAFNPTFDANVIERALAEDRQLFGAEYLSEWRDDLATFISRALLEAAVDADVIVRPPQEGVIYFAFDDPSGGAREVVKGVVMRLRLRSRSARVRRFYEYTP